MRRYNMNIGGIVYNKSALNGKSNDRLITLLNLIEQFNRLNDAEKMLAEIATAARALMNTEASSIMLLNEETNELCIKSNTGPLEKEFKNECIPYDQGLSGWIVKHKLPLVANDIDNETENNTIFGADIDQQISIQNVIGAPLLDNKNNVMGVILAINCYGSSKITEEDIPVFQALANHAATAIERTQASRKQYELLKEQDVYLTEIYHRVKNDLALISGIVEIESLDIEDEKAQDILENIQSRIKSMAVVYDLLSGEGSHTQAEVGTYLKKLVHGISESLQKRNRNIDINVQTEPAMMDAYKALSCGLILNEMLHNSYKYAFIGRDEGRIDIELTKDKNNITIVYKDDGPGLPYNFQLENDGSTGFEMIRALVNQLDGSLEIKRGNGACFMIEFTTEEEQESTPLENVTL